MINMINMINRWGLGWFRDTRDVFKKVHSFGMFRYISVHGSEQRLLQYLERSGKERKV
jgi:hypothetical protein